MGRVAAVAVAVLSLAVWGIHGAPPATACSCSVSDGPTPTTVQFTATLRHVEVLDPPTFVVNEHWTFDHVKDASGDVGERPLVYAAVSIRPRRDGKISGGGCGSALAAEPGRVYRLTVFPEDDHFSTGGACSPGGSVVDVADPHRVPQPLGSDPLVFPDQLLPVVSCAAVVGAAFVIRRRLRRRRAATA